MRDLLEDGEVERKTQSDRVSRRELGNGNVRSSLVSLERLVGRVFSLVTGSKLGEVSVVVSHPASSAAAHSWVQSTICSHLVVEHLGFTRSSAGDEVLVKDLEDVLADLGKLGLDLLSVSLDHGDLSLVSLALFLLLDGGDDSPRSTSSTDDVLVGDGEEVSLLDSELLIRRSDRFHVLDHFCEARQSTTRGKGPRPVDSPSYRSACSASLAR